MKSLLILLGLLLQAVSQQQTQTGTLVGRVLAVDGTPGADLRVAALPEGSSSVELPSTARTDRTGRYRLENLTQGRRYYITVTRVIEPVYDSPDPASLRSADATWFPGASTQGAATLVSVGSGGEQELREFRLALPSFPKMQKVSGRVTREDKKQTPADQSQVRLSPRQGPSLFGSIASDGSFEIQNVPLGRYEATVGPRTTMTPVEVILIDKDVSGVELNVPQPSAISGQILLRDGTPAADLRVNAITVGRRYAGVPSPPLTTQTDRTGHYRFEQVLPGLYHVAAGSAGAQTYFPGVIAQAAATSVAVGPGETVVDFRLAVTAVKISGLVVREGNQTPAANQMQVRLQGVGGTPGARGAVGARPNAIQPPMVTTTIAADGSFEFLSVPTSRYQAVVTNVADMQPVDVVIDDKDINGLLLFIPVIVKVNGTIALESGGVLPHVQVKFAGKSGTASFTAGEKFSVPLPTGDYDVTVAGLPTGYGIKSLTSGSTDLRTQKLKITAVDSPVIAVTLSASSPAPWIRVSGRVTGSDAGAAASRTITLINVVAASFPIPQSIFGGAHVATKAPVEKVNVPLSSDGSFAFPMVLPGTYTVHVSPTTANGPFPRTIVVGNTDLPNVELTPPSTRDLAGEFIRIPKGTFMMGCSAGDNECSEREKPPHVVRITKDLEMGKYEVTQAQWEAVMGTNPSSLEGAVRPVESVTWKETQDFISKLNARNDGYRYRLPTEAEWEYAARAGTSGSFAGSLDAMGWYESNSVGQTHPVGQKQPNAWGLHDMHGNVWEWIQDSYDDWTYYGSGPQTDPVGTDSDYHIMRGSSFLDDPWSTRVSVRFSFFIPESRNYKNPNIGFRLAREPSR